MITRKKIVFFLVSVFCSAAAITAAGWLTDLQQMMHGALVSILVFAFLPFLIVLAILGVFLIAMIIVPLLFLPAAIVSGGDVDIPVDGEMMEKVGHVGGALASVPLLFKYYSLLAGIRHPFFWGVPVGVLLGGLVLWAAIGLIVIPGETETTRILAETQTQIEHFYKEKGRFPKPDDKNQLLRTSLNPEKQDHKKAEPVRDGFGRPIYYQTSGKWKFSSYLIRSYGFDGRPGKDDLCLAGATKAMQWTDIAAETVLWLTSLKKEEKGPVTKRLAAIKALRCPLSVER